METSAAGMVSWGWRISERVDRSDGIAGGAGALRGREARKCGGEGGTDCGGGIEKAAVDGADSGTAAQGRHEEGRCGGACASRDDDDGRLDRATVADGNQNASDGLVV